MCYCLFPRTNIGEGNFQYFLLLFYVNNNKLFNLQRNEILIMKTWGFFIFKYAIILIWWMWCYVLRDIIVHTNFSRLSWVSLVVNWYCNPSCFVSKYKSIVELIETMMPVPKDFQSKPPFAVGQYIYEANHFTACKAFTFFGNICM